MTDDTRFDILDQVQEAQEEFEEDIEEENERYKNRKKIHRERKREYEEDYQEKLGKVLSRPEIHKLQSLAQDIEELNQKKSDLMEDIKDIFYIGVNSFVDGKRATGNKCITVKNGGIHSYGKQKNTELSLGSAKTSEDGLKAAMKKTDRYEDFLQMWEVLQKINVDRSFNIETVVELNSPVQFQDRERKYIEYSARYPERVDIMEAEVYEEGKYRRSNRYSIDANSLTNVSERDSEPEDLEAAVRFHDQIEQAMKETLTKCKEQLQEYKDLKKELAKPAQSAVLAHQL